MTARRVGLYLTIVGLSMFVPGCDPFVEGKNDLDHMETAKVAIGDHTIDVWVARSPLEQQRGLMFVTADEMDPDQGMLFVFPREELRGFWMANTPQALDILFLRTDGTVVHQTTMRAFDRSTYSSIEPARYVLELRAGRCAELGVHVGDRVILP
jgi:uncharacterized membrane protein (UPF0127 family)